jgi:plastocyanin
MIVRTMGWPRLAVAVMCASLLAGCTAAPDSTTSTASPDAAAKPPAGPVPSRVVTGKVPTLPGGMSSFVILTPADPGATLPAPASSVMDQVQREFIPSLLFVRTGQETQFRNSDSEFHNVSVRDTARKTDAFNVGIPPGAVHRHTFEHDGFYDVSCDIHPAMSATIVAASTPYTAMADDTGSFTMYGVEPGSYNATVYAGGRNFQRTVQVTGDRTELDLSDLAASPGQ